MGITRRRFLQIPIPLTVAALCRADTSTDSQSDLPKVYAEQDTSPLAELPKNAAVRSRQAKEENPCANTDPRRHLQAHGVHLLLRRSGEKITLFRAANYARFRVRLRNDCAKPKRQAAPKKRNKALHAAQHGAHCANADNNIGIDILQTRTKSIAKLLDFPLITHKHVDHYSPAPLRSMGDKPIASNFIENKFKQNSDTQKIQIRKY